MGSVAALVEIKGVALSAWHVILMWWYRFFPYIELWVSSLDLGKCIECLLYDDEWECVASVVTTHDIY